MVYQYAGHYARAMILRKINSILTNNRLNIHKQIESFIFVVVAFECQERRIGHDRKLSTYIKGIYIRVKTKAFSSTSSLDHKR